MATATGASPWARFALGLVALQAVVHQAHHLDLIPAHRQHRLRQHLAEHHLMAAGQVERPVGGHRFGHDRLGLLDRLSRPLQVAQVHLDLLGRRLLIAFVGVHMQIADQRAVRVEALLGVHVVVIIAAEGLAHHGDRVALEHVRSHQQHHHRNQGQPPLQQPPATVFLCQVFQQVEIVFPLHRLSPNWPRGPRRLYRHRVTRKILKVSHLPYDNYNIQEFKMEPFGRTPSKGLRTILAMPERFNKFTPFLT